MRLCKSRTAYAVLADPTTKGRRAQRGRGSGATDDVFKKSSLILSKEWAYFVKFEILRAYCKLANASCITLPTTPLTVSTSFTAMREYTVVGCVSWSYGMSQTWPKALT